MTSSLSENCPSPSHSNESFDALRQQFEVLMQALEKGQVNSENLINPELLLAFRKKLSACLQNDDLPIGHRHAIERMRRELHPVQRIGQLYSYQSSTEKSLVDLKIQWDSIDFDTLIDEVVFDLGRLADKPPERYSFNFARNKPIILKAEPVNLVFYIYPEIAFNNQRLFKMSLRHPFKYDSSFLGPVADFHFVHSISREEERWEMQHRIVLPEFRCQGISTKLIGLMKSALKKRQEEVQMFQKITAKIAQVDVLFSLLEKNKFQPSSNEDQQRIGHLLSADERLMLASSPKDSSKILDTMDWFIFEKEKWELIKDDPCLWSSWPQEGQPHYTEDAFMINLEKRID